MIPDRPTKRTSGYTLIDVALAVGIGGPALVAILGLMAAGHSSLQNAQTRESEAAILQTVSGHFQMRPWSEVQELEARGDYEIFFFDAEGYRMETDGEDRIFAARARVLEPPSLPGASPSKNSGRETFSRRLEISIDPRPVPESELFSKDGSFSTHTILIVNSSNDRGTNS